MPDEPTGSLQSGSPSAERFVNLPDLTRVLLDSMTEGVSLSDEGGTMIYTNRAEDLMFGYEPGELVGKHVSVQNAYPPEENERRVAEVIAQLKERGAWRGEWLNRRKDGTTFVSTSRISAVEIERRPHWLCVQEDITDEAAATAQLKHSQARLELALNAADLGIWDWDLATGRIEYSLRAKEICGFPPDHDVTFEDAKRVTHPDDLPRTSLIAQRALDPATRENAPYNYRIVRGDGSIRWVIAHGEAVFETIDGQTRPVRYAGTLQDITDRVLLEEADRVNQARLALAIEAGKMAVWEIDVATDQITGSVELNKILGFPDDSSPTAEEIRARYFPGERERVRGLAEAELALGRTTFEVDFRYVWPDGSVRWLWLRADAVIRDGKPERFVGVMMDVTERKRAEEHLRTLNETGAAVAAELDVHRVVQLVTDAGVKLTGAKFGAFFYNIVDESGEALLLYTLSGAERSEFERFGHPRATAIFAPTFNGDGVVRSDDITMDPRYGQNPPNKGMPEGHLPVRSYLAVPVTSRSGEVIGGLFFGHPDPGVFTDASEQLMLGLAGQAAISVDNARLFEAAKRANQSLEQRVEERTRDLEQAHDALRQSQKMEAIGQLTGGIAHDFNNLLTVIKGSADLLQRGDLTETKKKRYIDAISDTADRATKLTGQLLAFARRQALKPELFDVFVTIEGVADMLRTMMGSRVTFTLKNDCGECFVEADLAQFETALVNLAVNARDAMDGEGNLTISVDKDVSSGVTGAVLLRVSDSGAGIAPEEIDRIFEPFYTTKEVGKGTGLGLSQVYGFVKQSDGEVAVESEVGRGTTFTLTLPLAQASEATVHTSDLKSPELARGGRVLIVEDNRQVGEFACQLLSDLGFDAVLEENAKDALGRLELEASDFDLIFSDVVMPGMDGVTFGRIVREKWQNLPVVLTSGYSHVLAEDTRHGFPLVHKPYSAAAVAAALREARQPA